MNTQTRRCFTKETLGSLLTFSLLETLYASDAFGREIKPVTAAWLADVNQLSQDLKGEKIDQIQWQRKVELLMAKVDMADMLKFIDFEKLTAQLKLKKHGEGELSLRPKFPEVEGLPTKRVFGHQLFALGKGRSVVPHGHNNMATSFLVMGGEFHGRHYDRLEDDGQHMIIKPTIDRSFGVGGYSTISDHRDNVHWFKATSEKAFLFNIHVLSVKPGRAGRVYIDPNGEKLSGGRIKARKIRTAREAFELYG